MSLILDAAFGNQKTKRTLLYMSLGGPGGPKNTKKKITVWCIKIAYTFPIF